MKILNMNIDIESIVFTMQHKYLLKFLYNIHNLHKILSEKYNYEAKFVFRINLY